MRKLLVAFLILLSLSIAAILIVPWQGLVQKKLVAMLSAKGFVSPALTIDHIGLHGLVLKDVMVGNPPLKLATLTIAYDARALREGQIHDVEIGGLSLHAVQTPEGWQVEGMEDLLRSNAADKPVAIPVTLAELKQLPLRSLSMRDSAMILAGSGWEAHVPLEGKLQQGSDATIHLASKGVNFTMGETAVAIGAITLDLALDDAKQQWQGTWKIEDIATTSETLGLPSLNATGTLTVTGDTIQATGNIVGSDTSYSAAFSVNYAFNAPDASHVTVTNAWMPLSGGTVSIRNVKLPLNGTKPVAFTLQVSNVAIDSTLQAMTGSKATATGAVSGAIPVIITRDGTIRVGKSALTADAPGTIALAPDAIPGDNPQVALVRDVLKNLHYTVLALGLDMAPDGKMIATLAVEGRNPDVEKGRPIKLKVHLSGDLLNLITQNLKLMTDPKTFIQQNTHEKH